MCHHMTQAQLKQFEEAKQKAQAYVPIGRAFAIRYGYARTANL